MHIFSCGQIVRLGDSGNPECPYCARLPNDGEQGEAFVLVNVNIEGVWPEAMFMILLGLSGHRGEKACLLGPHFDGSKVPFAIFSVSGGHLSSGYLRIVRLPPPYERGLGVVCGVPSSLEVGISQPPH
jgi:hypothetical protein